MKNTKKAVRKLCKKHMGRSPQPQPPSPQFVKLVFLQKASDDYRGYVIYRYNNYSFELRGTWAATAADAAHNAMCEFNNLEF